MDTLKYSETVLTICFAGMGRPEANDALRQVYLHKDKIRVCPCVMKSKAHVWLRESLQNLGAIVNNETSH
jgi:hypothetical protein